MERITLGGAPKASAPDRGELVAKAFPLFRAATPLEDVAERLLLDPDVVLALPKMAGPASADRLVALGAPSACAKPDVRPRG